MTEREREKYEEIINHEKDVIKEFAEKIKSHMMMYCQSRIEQQYCALEVIDYIGKLMGEKDFSIDVEKEMEEHDEAIRADERRKFTEWLLKHNKFDLADSMLIIQKGIDDLLNEYEKEQK